MINTQLEALKEYILKYNPYFTNGFVGVYKDENGLRVNEMPVFPNDTLGDYFYFRVVSPTPFVIEQISGCSVTVSLNATVWLVAVMNKADQPILAANLVTTIGGLKYQPRNVVMHPNDIIRQELSGMSKETISQALANAGGQTMLAISFTMDAELQHNKVNCLPNPCTLCG